MCGGTILKVLKITDRKDALLKMCGVMVVIWQCGLALTKSY